MAKFKNSEKTKNQEKTYNVEPLRSINEINEFRTALKFMASNPERAKRDEFVFTFAINVGLRMGDIVKLKVGQVRNVPRLKIIEQKTGKVKVLYLEAIQEDIERYTRGMRNEEWLFPSTRNSQDHIKRDTVYRIFNKAASKLGRNDIGTHTCRKTFGYHYYQRTHDIATLMVLFNHSSEEVTKRYIGIREDEVGESLKDFRL